MHAFGDVAAALGEMAEQDDLLHLIARKTCEIVEVERCSVYLRDEETGLFRGQVGHADHDIDALVKRLVCGTAADGFTREIVATQSPVLVQNATTDPRPVRSAMRAWNVVSMLGVPMILKGEIVGIVFLDSERPHQFTATHQATAAAFADLAATAIFQSRIYHELRVGHATLARQNQVLRRANAMDDRLTGLVLEGRNLGEIAQTVSDLTHKHCAVFDAEHRCLAAGAPAEAAEPFTIRLLDAEMASRPEVAEALAATTPTKTQVLGPFPSVGLQCRFLVAPITARQQRWATLVIAEHGGRFNGFDMLLSRRAATVVALELSAERRAANAEWNARASLAGELIRGNRDTDELESRAQHLAVDLSRQHVLCLLTAREGDGVDMPDARAAALVLERVMAGVNVLATGVAEGIAAIIPLSLELTGKPGVESLKPLLAEACRELSPNGHLIAGVSTACRGSDGFVRAYEQARQAAQCLDIFCPPGTEQVLAADDLGAARLFLATSDAVEADRFATETLGPLLDDGVGPEVLETLSCFFAHSRSVRQSAAALEVHENTIRYRLARIEELTGLPVAGDTDAQLSAQLALLVLRLRGRLPQETLH
jgi:DNA-binding PucR family transcriptional regulator